MSFFFADNRGVRKVASSVHLKEGFLAKSNPKSSVSCLSENPLVRVIVRTLEQLQPYQTDHLSGFPQKPLHLPNYLNVSQGHQIVAPIVSTRWFVECMHHL